MLAGNGADGGGGLAVLESGRKRGASAGTYGCAVTSEVGAAVSCSNGGARQRRWSGEGDGVFFYDSGELQASNSAAYKIKQRREGVRADEGKELG